MSARILAVSVDLASEDIHHERFNSRVSLLDWDIVLIRPEISEFYSYEDDTYLGKRCLDDDGSFRLKECCAHWRREIKQAVETGKTVIVYLPPLEEVYVATGNRTYSGTGRSRQTTRHVELYNNYQAIPATLDPVGASGTSMKLAAKGAEILAAYWAEFAGSSTYEVILGAEKVPTSITTRAGDKPVGAMYRSKTSFGTMLLLPDIDFNDEDFFEETDGKTHWTAAGRQFAGRLISTVVALDKALRSSSEVTPEPSWAANSKYSLGPEAVLQSRLLEAERNVELAQREKEEVADQLLAAGRHRALLYEKGPRLELAIIEALRAMGFSAAPFKESDSEFDVVFESGEGRLIGEAEGKDNKPVNVDKLRQLSMNIHEDLQREEISVPAKPVLFGNGFRLQPVDERPDPFTEKCYSAAATSSTALVNTPDLFLVLQNLVEQDDPEYARACRQALLTSVGRVTFPVSASKDRLLPNTNTVADDA